MRWLIVMSLVLASRVEAQPGSETKAIAAVIDAQFAALRDPTNAPSVYAPNATIAMTGGSASPQVSKLDNKNARWSIFGPDTVGKHKVKDLRVVIARDGKSAWASFVANVKVDGLGKTGAADYRATELFVKTASGWQIQGAAWSLGVANAALAKAAKAGTFAELETVFDQDLGEREVLAAVKAFATTGLDATAAARTDVVGVGPTVKEVTVGGKQLAAKLTKEWLGKLALDGATWAVTAGTTACATVNAKLARGGANVPTRLFAVFERDAAGAWSPVLVHLAAAPPAR